MTQPSEKRNLPFLVELIFGVYVLYKTIHGIASGEDTWLENVIWGVLACILVVILIIRGSRWLSAGQRDMPDDQD